MRRLSRLHGSLRGPYQWVEGLRGWVQLDLILCQGLSADVLVQLCDRGDLLLLKNCHHT